MSTVFPSEIWEHIFTYVDPVKLTRLRSTCKSWNTIIAKILKKSELWNKLCEDEIPKQFWSTLCETICPNKFYTNFHKKNDAMFWMSMYKLWTKSKNITKCSTQVKCIDLKLKNNSSEYITCTDTSANLLAVGTSEGFIYFYDICNLSAHTKHVVDHLEYVQSVKFVRDETNTVCMAHSTNNHISFWDVDTLMQIDDTLGKLICTSYGFCYIAIRNMITIEGCIPRTTYEFGSDSIIAVGADNNKVLFYTEGGYWVHFTLDDKSDKRNYYTYTHVQPPNIRIRRYYIFKPDIVACITEHGYMGFLLQTREWKIYNMFPIVHGTPTAILIYAHVLIIGLDSGNVHIYYIDDFESIDFDTINCKKLTLDTTAVVSLNMMAHNSEEYIIVTYSKKIYVVKFV